jgi:DUF1680 family protein
MSNNGMAAYHLCPLDFPSIQLTGSLDQRIRLGLQHLLAERMRILGGEGFGQAWGADQLGRWIGAVALASHYTGEGLPDLAQTFRACLAAQDASGFFGTTLNSSTWWGAGRALIGLLEYWTRAHEAEALQAATKLGNFYLANFPLLAPGLTIHHGGHEEGLVALAQATGNPAYLRLAEKIPETIDTEFGIPGQPQPNHHTHSYLCSMRGCVDLFLATRNPEFLRRAQDTWEHVQEHNLWVSGGISEGSNYPFETRDETCSVADWFRLSLKLWQATGDAKYMDAAEHALLNQLYFDQDHSGGFCTFRSLGEDKTGSVRDVVAWFCCSMSGLRALLEAARFVFAHADESIAVNLFTSAQATISLANGTVHLRQNTAYPSETTVHVAVDPERECAFALKIRVPAWANSFVLAVNGETVAATVAQGYATVRRVWQPGDVIELSFEPYLRLVPGGVNGFSAAKTGRAGSQTATIRRAALVYGPLVLMLDPSLNIYEMFSWGDVEIVVPQTKDGEPFLPRAAFAIPGRGPFAVPQMCFMTLAREQGGEAIGAVTDESWKLAFMVPISEITGRWTYTLSRATPYEARNDIRVLDSGQHTAFLAHVQTLCASFIRQRKADTAAPQMGS